MFTYQFRFLRILDKWTDNFEEGKQTTTKLDDELNNWLKLNNTDNLRHQKLEFQKRDQSVRAL